MLRNRDSALSSGERRGQFGAAESFDRPPTFALFLDVGMNSNLELQRG